MRIWALVLVGACYAPMPSPGAPCSIDRTCPTGLVCAIDGKCELTAGSPADGPAPTDTGDAPTVTIDARPADAAASPDSAPMPTCWAAWASGAPAISTPVEIAEISSATYDEADPSLSGDGLTIYFTRGTPATANTIDLYSATRATRTSPFGTPVAMTTLNSPQDESKFSVTADGLTGVLATKKMGTGTLTDSNLLQTTRATTTVDFGAPSEGAFGTMIDDFNQQYDPDLSANGLVLYYSVVPLIGGMEQIVRTSRANLTDAFSTIGLVTIAGTSGVVADPAVSPDEKAMLFSSAAPENDIYLTTRTTAVGSFGTPVALTAVNTASFDGDPALSRDGCELFFSSDRAGTRDIYRSTVAPQ